jgi:hypothetical protein
MRRYYALLLTRGGGVQLVKSLDGERVLAAAEFDWELGESHHLSIDVAGNRIVGFVDGKPLVEVLDEDRPLNSGGIGVVLTEGRMATHEVRVGPGTV